VVQILSSILIFNADSYSLSCSLHKDLTLTIYSKIRCFKVYFYVSPFKTISDARPLKLKDFFKISITFLVIKTDY